jgi:antitoxin component YwqK of YwqJK toxin-antitoxin module
MTTKVCIEHLDIAEDGGGQLLYNGRPFSGIAYEYDEYTGAPLAVVGIRNGAKHGVWREWNSSGRMKLESYFCMGFRHGSWREWHDNGQILYEASWKCDLLVQRKQWNERGELTEEYHMLPGSPLHRTLEERRKEPFWCIVDINVETLEFVE